MTCMEILGSGLPIGMDVRIRTVVRGVIRVRPVCFVVVPGATPRAASGRRTGATTTRRTATTLTVFDFARSLIPRLYSTQEFIMPKKQEFPLNPEIFFLKISFPVSQSETFPYKRKESSQERNVMLVIGQCLGQRSERRNRPMNNIKVRPRRSNLEPPKKYI